MKTGFIIKHDDIDVCTIAFTGSFRIERVDQIMSPEHLPPYILHSSGRDIYKFDEWYSGRAISNNREGIQDILLKYNVNSPRELLLKNYGLSLYDHYWVCPANKNLKWKDINFFENSFKEDAGNILIGDFSNEYIEGLTPESSSGGALPKKWVCRGGGTYLIKRGSGYYRQEPFNEVIASAIMKKLGIDCVDYSLEREEGEPRCCCKNMLGTGEELIHAWDIVHEIKAKEDKYKSFLQMAENAGINNIELDLDKMLSLDYIIANTDRHFNNIGFIRNARTLEYKGLAPVYDSGASLWHDKTADEIIGGENTACKPFKSHHRDQIKKVRHLGWFDVNKRNDINEIICEVLLKNNKIDQKKLSAIIRNVLSRVDKIERIKYELAKQKDYGGYGR